MKADSLQMVKVFSSGGDIHYVLPHFQREYAWEKQEWQTLLNDIFGIYEIYQDEKPPEHFMGSLVVINDGTQAGTVPVFRLVDGQQRLTTISLLLCALERQLEDDEAYVGLRKKIRRMLMNQDESGDLYYKLLPTTKYGDRVSYCAIIRGKQPPEGLESKVPGAFEYLTTQLGNRLKSDQVDPNRLFNVLMTSLQVVFINLSQNERPYEIFESLNYKGKSLTQADLVRNYIAMKLSPGRQEPVFTELWSPIEEMLLEKRTVGRSRLGELTAFLRHYFAYHSGALINQEHVYSRFRDRGEAMSEADFEAELTTIKRFAGYYDRLLRPQNEPDKEVRRQLERLNVMESSTGYPFLLFMYDIWQSGQIGRDEFLAGLGLLEIYMVRRFLNQDSTNYLNKMFPPLVKDLGKDIGKAEFAASLKEALGTKNEPSDVRLRQSAETIRLYRRDILTRQKLALVLDGINRRLSSGSGAYTVLNSDPTIEHIMPQTLTEAWKQHLGENWQQDFELLHTLGNLTLVTQDWNSQLSNSIYATKRQRLAEHGLLLNQNYFRDEAPERWNGQSIRGRAQWLMAKATEIWPQLGEAAAGWEERPRNVVILGDIYPVASWRDVLRRTADVAVEWTGADFEQRIIAQYPTYFARQPFEFASYELSNGWWIYVNLSGETVRQISSAIVAAAGIPEDEFEITYW
ncbi:MAG TPA: hypothetical protein DEP84_24415 [Chloroflexi bacterium]|nr:hypothetical protein [Chloroflexota bacterium]